MKKNILIAMTALYNGGAERSLVNFLIELPKDKYNIDLLLFKKEGLFLSQVPDNVNILNVPCDIKALYGTFKDAAKNKKLIFKLISNISSMICNKKNSDRKGFRWKYFYTRKIKKIEKKYDIAIAYISGEILYFIDEKVNANKKIVWVHNDYRSASHSKRYEYNHFKNMDYIISISQSCVDIFKEEFPEFSNKTILLENITSSKLIKKRSIEFYPSEYKDNEINILSIGRLNIQKGFDIAIKAAKHLKENNIKFKWFVIGTGELKGELKRQIQNNDLEENFILLGAKENPYPYIKNCTILVQPSRFEGKSVVLDETKILAKPIVVTAYPTVFDQIIDRKEGIIAELNENDLAEKIQYLLNNTGIQEQLKRYLEQKEYGNQREINKYYDIIDS